MKPKILLCDSCGYSSNNRKSMSNHMRGVCGRNGVVCLKCRVCGETKPLADFYLDKSKRFRSSGLCKICKSANIKEKRRTDNLWRERQNKRAKEWRDKHPQRNKNSIRNSTLKKKYGIGIDEYNILLKSQNGMCAICGTTKYGGYGRMAVDHCHESGKIRGLLCQPCNVTLGKMGEDISRLEKMIYYIKKHKNKEF